MRRALVAGWFSFENMGATAGDLIARDLVCDWLRDGGVPFDVAVAAPFADGIDWRQCRAADYSHLLFVCGPFGNGPPVDEMLERFAGCRLVGIDLSMLDTLENCNPFHLLLERDSSAHSRPDLVFLAPPRSVPVVGVVLVHPQAEYGRRGMHRQANEAIAALIERSDVAAVNIDTRLDRNSTGLRTAAQVESLIARMDAVLTTRLHGTVFALKNGVPALAIDPIAGGAKLLQQARTLGWPTAFTADAITPDRLDAALDHCLSPEGRREAETCRRRAVALLEGTRERLLEELA